MTTVAGLAIGTALLLSTLATSAYADQQQPEIGSAVACSRPINGCTAYPDLLDDVQATAAEEGVNPLDLLGALNDLRDAGIDVSAHDYLAADWTVAARDCP